MMISLSEHQLEAVRQLKSGMILVGGVGSGKSRTGLYYYFTKESGKDLYIITTARKRDTCEWEEELQEFKTQKTRIFVDSWNNINKYVGVKGAFFIFDEQRIVGSGMWVKSYLKIVKNNNWILLTATPGDTWIDYIPVLIANGFYKNRTEFLRSHVIYNNYSRYPKIDRYVGISKLIRLRNSIVVNLRYDKKTILHHKTVNVPFNKEVFNTVMIGRWNVYEKRPIKNASELCYTLRKVVNSDSRRIDILTQLLENHSKVIVFYNFDYERELLLKLGEKLQLAISEWNGYNHQEIPNTSRWLYIVQYTAGAEGWNCTKTDTIVFYSQNYSYKAMIQAAGRIDRRNTSFTDLYYYYFISNSLIDLAIKKAFDSKKNFNEQLFSRMENIDSNREGVCAPFLF